MCPPDVLRIQQGVWRDLLEVTAPNSSTDEQILTSWKFRNDSVFFWCLSLAINNFPFSLFLVFHYRLSALQSHNCYWNTHDLSRKYFLMSQHTCFVALDDKGVVTKYFISLQKEITKQKTVPIIVLTWTFRNIFPTPLVQLLDFTRRM